MGLRNYYGKRRLQQEQSPSTSMLEVCCRHWLATRLYDASAVIDENVPHRLVGILTRRDLIKAYDKRLIEKATGIER
ncbi:MAG: hypothetical protein ACE5JC_09145 [Candidatus Zixiibacteriota bacterium]